MSAPARTVSPAVAHLLDRLARVAEDDGDGFVARCPAHDDTAAALRVRAGKDGRANFHCTAGCDKARILDALGMTWGEVFRGPLGPRPTILTASASPTRVVDVAEGFDLSAYAALAEARVGARPVLVCDGEPSADAARVLGYTATASTGGPGTWDDAFGASFPALDVYVLPPTGPAGAAWAARVAASVAASAGRPHVVALPGLGDGQTVAAWLASDAGTLDALDAALEATPEWRPARPSTGRWTLRDLLTDEQIMRPPTPVVPHLAWAKRCTLFAAAEKTGKSTGCGVVASAVSRGGDFLGEPCNGGQPGVVLIFGLEEFLGDLARRLHAFGADPDRIHIVDQLPGDPEARIALVRRHVEDVQPALAIIDTLFAYANGAISDASSSAQMGPVVQAITDLAHRSETAVLLTHHARKSDGRYRDSSAIGGAVDVIAEMSAPDEDADPSKRLVRVRGRVPVRDFAMRWTGYDYTLAAATGPAPIDERVLAFVRATPESGLKAIRDAIGGRAADVDLVVDRLEREGRLIDAGSPNYHRYRVAAARRPSEPRSGALWPTER